MELTKTFEWHGASCAGLDHTGFRGDHFGGSNEDAIAKYPGDDLIILVACDGCSGGSSTESTGNVMGAQESAWATVKAVREIVQERGLQLNNGQFWERVATRMLAKLEINARLLFGEKGIDISPEEWQQQLEDRMLATVLCAVVTSQLSQLQVMGDGIHALNGVVKAIPKFPGNAPPYPAKALYTEGLVARFHQLWSIPTWQLKSFCFGTDGMEAIIEAEDRMIPGAGVPVGPLSQLWTEDRFFEDPTTGLRWLRGLNRQVRTKQGWQDGLYKDDASYWALRRKGVS